jgi:hypothetical protein
MHTNYKTDQHSTNRHNAQPEAAELFCTCTTEVVVSNLSIFEFSQANNVTGPSKKQGRPFSSPNLSLKSYFFCFEGNTASLFETASLNNVRITQD